LNQFFAPEAQNGARPVIISKIQYFKFKPLQTVASWGVIEAGYHICAQINFIFIDFHFYMKTKCKKNRNRAKKHSTVQSLDPSMSSLTSNMINDYNRTTR